jgi:hypothetical protein
VQVDAVARDFADIRDLVERNVDLNAQHPTALVEQKTQIHELESRRFNDGLDDRDQLLLEWIA